MRKYDPCPQRGYWSAFREISMAWQVGTGRAPEKEARTDQRTGKEQQVIGPGQCGWRVVCVHICACTWRCRNLKNVYWVGWDCGSAVPSPGLSTLHGVTRWILTRTKRGRFYYHHPQAVVERSLPKVTQLVYNEASRNLHGLHATGHRGTLHTQSLNWIMMEELEKGLKQWWLVSLCEGGFQEAQLKRQ